MKDGIILKTGTYSDLEKLTNSETKMINLDGKTMIPGFIEGHGHIMGVGYNEMNLDLLQTSSYDEIIEKASIKVVTQDSINMIYESLSTKGQTLLFNMKYIKINKIINQIDILLSNKRVGYVENVQMVDGLDKIKIISQNMHNDVFAEVEKVAYKLIQELRSKSI